MQDSSLYGSLAGAAHLLNDNAGVLRRSQFRQKRSIDRKGKRTLDSRPSVLVPNVKARPCDPFVPYCNVQHIESRGDRKITTGITGLWSQECMSTLLFDPSMSALPILSPQKRTRVGLFTR